MTAKAKTSKRQNLKKLQSNDLNRIPQQPRIKTAAQRAKADILQSGLGLKAPTKKNQPQQLLDPSLDLNSPEVKFGRSLASSDASGRHKSVNQLRFYLKARCDIANESGGISELDLMKLWKGLWYCLYMADKVPVQDELSKRLSELIWCFEGTEEEDEYASQMYLNLVADVEDEELMEGEEDNDLDDPDVTMKVIEDTRDNSEEEDSRSEDHEEDSVGSGEEENGDENDENAQESYLVKHCRGAHLAALFIKTFFVTVRREWGNMDKYRVDKFYTLMRFMMGEVYKYMAKRQWNYGVMRLFNDHLYDEILSQLPNGIRYHIIDLALDQLAIVNKKHASLVLTEVTLVEVLDPFFGLCQTEKDATVQDRVVEKVLKKFLYEYSVVGNKVLNEDEDDDEDEDFTLKNVHVGSISEFVFSLASHEDTRDKYRKSLYAVFKEYEKRLKLVGKDVELDGDDSNLEEDYDNEAVDAEGTEGSSFEAEAEERDESVKEETSKSVEKESSSKKNKGKKKKRKSKTEKTEISTPSEKNQDQLTNEVGKKKKRKKSSKDSKDAVDVKENDTKNEKDEKPKKRKKEKDAKDEIIVISTLDQKQARQASTSNGNVATKKQKKKKESKVNVKQMTNADKLIPGDDEGDSEEHSRRVIFRKVNRSKSHKASMKDLKTMEHTSTALKTPEKGILRTKAPKIVSGEAGGKKKRKKKRKN